MTDGQQHEMSNLFGLSMPELPASDHTITIDTSEGGATSPVSEWNDDASRSSLARQPPILDWEPTYPPANEMKPVPMTRTPADTIGQLAKADNDVDMQPVPTPPRTAPPKPSKSRRRTVKTERKKATAPVETKKRGNAKRKRPDSELDEQALKRKRHNEVEIRRRQRMKARFAELQQLTGCARKSQSAVLVSAIETVASLKQEVEELKKQAAKFESRLTASNQLTDASSVPVVVCQPDGRVVECNNQFASLVGLPRSKVRNYGQILEQTQADYRPYFFRSIDILLIEPHRTVTFTQVINQSGVDVTYECRAWLVGVDSGKPHIHCSLVPKDSMVDVLTWTPPEPSAMKDEDSDDQSSGKRLRRSTRRR